MREVKRLRALVVAQHEVIHQAQVEGIELAKAERALRQPDSYETGIYAALDIQEGRGLSIEQTWDASRAELRAAQEVYNAAATEVLYLSTST